MKRAHGFFVGPSSLMLDRLYVSQITPELVCGVTGSFRFVVGAGKLLPKNQERIDVGDLFIRHAWEHRSLLYRFEPISNRVLLWVPWPGSVEFLSSANATRIATIEGIPKEIWDRNLSMNVDGQTLDFGLCELAKKFLDRNLIHASQYSLQLVHILRTEILTEEYTLRLVNSEGEAIPHRSTGGVE